MLDVSKTEIIITFLKVILNFIILNFELYFKYPKQKY